MNKYFLFFLQLFLICTGLVAQNADIDIADDWRGNNKQSIHLFAQNGQYFYTSNMDTATLSLVRLASNKYLSMKGHTWTVIDQQQIFVQDNNNSAVTLVFTRVKKDQVVSESTMAEKPTTNSVKTSANTANRSITKGLNYNFVAGLPVGFTFIRKNYLYAFNLGSNSYANMFRADFGYKLPIGIYAEMGCILYSADIEELDAAFDWELGYMNKIKLNENYGLTYSVGVHVVQLSSGQISLGLGLYWK